MSVYYTDLRFFDNEDKLRKSKLVTSSVVDQLVQADNTDFDVKGNYFKRKNPTLDELHKWFTEIKGPPGGKIPSLKKEVLHKLLTLVNAKTTKHRRNPTTKYRRNPTTKYRRNSRRIKNITRKKSWRRKNSL